MVERKPAEPAKLDEGGPSAPAPYLGFGVCGG